MRTWRSLSLVIAASIGLVVACGDDDGGDASSETSVDETSVDDASSEEFCELARQADAAGDEMTAALETQDPEEIERVFNDAMADFEAAVDAAPAAIRDVAAEVTDTARDLRDRFEELDWDVVALSEDEQALELAAQGEEANEELDRYLEQECDIPADTEAPEATSAPGTAPAGTDATGGALEETILDELTSQFVALGLTEEQASCLGESLLDKLGVDGLVGLADITDFDLSSPEGQAFIDALGECDIDPNDIAAG